MIHYVSPTITNPGIFHHDRKHAFFLNDYGFVSLERQTNKIRSKQKVLRCAADVECPGS